MKSSKSKKLAFAIAGILPLFWLQSCYLFCLFKQAPEEQMIVEEVIEEIIFNDKSSEKNDKTI